MQELQKTEDNEAEIEVYEKMVMRYLFVNINASRNSAYFFLVFLYDEKVI